MMKIGGERSMLEKARKIIQQPKQVIRLALRLPGSCYN
jgi:hypothetical protein